MHMRRPRVLYFIVQYPNFSETYMHEEIRSLRDQYDIKIITYARASEQLRLRPFPYELIEYTESCLVYGPIEHVDRTFSSPAQQEFLKKVGAVIQEFQPDILHAHYFGIGLLLNKLAELYNIPFTIRTHSMDLLSEPNQKLEALCSAANSFWCLGIIAFPPFRSRLLECGLSADKLVTCWPVINFKRFYKPDRRQPTNRVICAGPAIEKKAHNDFVDLAAMMRSSPLQFDLYAKGHYLPTTIEHNERAGNVVNITYADPDDMPDVFPQYDWLVYPADTAMNKVGLPAAIVEAQASGLGVCWQELPGRREGQLEFLAGGGFLFRSLDELPEILSAPYPETMRLRGLEAAKRCDIDDHKQLLIDLWDQAPSRRIEIVRDESALVSIIIPYYEQPDCLARSVQSALDQTYRNVEIVLVDDCSPKNPAAAVLSSAQLEKVRLIRHDTNRGVSAARNTAIRASSGEFIVPLDSDDLLEPAFVSECLMMANAGSYDCVYTHYRWFGELNQVMMPEVNLTNLLCRKESFPTLLFKRKVFDAIGGYREDMSAGSDTQFLLEVTAGDWQLGRVNKPLWHYRTHTDGLSKLHLYERMGTLVQINKALYEQHWEAIIPKLEASYIHILVEYHKVLAEYHKVLKVHADLKQHHSLIFSEYQKVLEAYERVIKDVPLSAQHRVQLSEDLLRTRTALNGIFSVIGTMSRPRSSRATARLRKIRAALRKTMRLAKKITSPACEGGESSSAFNSVVSSGIFDEHYYRQQCLDRGLQVADPISHFLHEGWKLGLNPNPFFDTNYYQSQLRELGECHERNPLLHYLQKGASMGLPASPWFDTAWYVDTYADVREAGTNPLVHFIHFGISEGRHTIGKHAALSALAPGVAAGTDTTLGSFSQSLGTSDTDLRFLTTNGTEPSSPYHLIVGIHEASRTGAPMLGMALARSLKHRGLNPLLVLYGPGELKEDMLEMADVLDLSGHFDKPAVLNRCLEHLSTEHLLPILRSGSANSRPLAILNSAELSPLHPVFKARGFEVVSLIHEYLSRYPFHYRERIWNDSDRLIFPAECVMNDSIVENANRAPTHTLLQGLIDPDFGRMSKQTARQILQSEIAAGPSDFIVLSCGTAEPRKGIDLFVQVARHVVSAAGNVHFVWIGGEPGTGTNSLQWAMIDVTQAGLSGRVHFLGHKKEIEPYFVGADLFLLPSRQDPAPCVVHMAQSCAVPVIAFAGAGGTEEILTHGGGRLAPYLDVQAMADLILDYHRNPDRMLTDGENGRKAVLEHYRFEDYVDRLLGLIGVESRRTTKTL